MKKFTSSIGFALALSLSSPAAGEENVQLKLNLEPVANQAELSNLMRQNSVRVALQRHRLWQKSVDSERQRQQKQLRERLHAAGEQGSKEGSQQRTRKQSRTGKRTQAQGDGAKCDAARKAPGQFDLQAFLQFRFREKRHQPDQEHQQAKTNPAGDCSEPVEFGRYESFESLQETLHVRGSVSGFRR